MLHDNSERLSSLADAVDEVLDLEEALCAMKRMMPQSGGDGWAGDLLRAAARAKGEIGQEGMR